MACSAFSKASDKKHIKFFAKAVGEFTVIENASGKIEMDFPNTKPEPIMILCPVISGRLMGATRIR